MRTPISETEMRVFLADQIAKLDDLTRPTWKKYKVPLHSVPHVREGSTEVLPMFAVAKAGNELLVYDDRDDQFATAEPDADGIVRKWVTYGEEMRAALRHFPRKPKPVAAASADHLSS